MQYKNNNTIDFNFNTETSENFASHRKSSKIHRHANYNRTRRRIIIKSNSTKKFSKMLPLTTTRIIYNLLLSNLLLIFILQPSQISANPSPNDLATDPSYNSDIPTCFETCATVNRCTKDRTCPNKYLQNKYQHDGKAYTRNNRYNCFPESRCPLPKNYRKPSVFLSMQEDYFLTNDLKLDVVSIGDNDDLSRFVDNTEVTVTGRRKIREPRSKNNRNKRSSSSVISDFISTVANQFQFSSTTETQSQRAKRSLETSAPQTTKTKLVSQNNNKNEQQQQLSNSQSNKLVQNRLRDKYAYLKYNHLGYFSTFFHIMSTEHDHTFSIYNNKYEKQNACLLPSSKNPYEVIHGHCDGSEAQNWIIYESILNFKNSTVYLLQNVLTKGCLSMNKEGLKLELAACEGNADKGIVMVPVNQTQYIRNKVLEASITRSPTVLKEIPEHKLSMLSDNIVYLIIHGSAVFAIFIIFCAFYYVHTHRKLFQDIIHL